MEIDPVIDENRIIFTPICWARLSIKNINFYSKISQLICSKMSPTSIVRVFARWNISTNKVYASFQVKLQYIKHDNKIGNTIDAHITAMPNSSLLDIPIHLNG